MSRDYDILSPFLKTKGAQHGQDRNSHFEGKAGEVVSAGQSVENLITAWSHAR
jgi:hypothetical protein